MSVRLIIAAGSCFESFYVKWIEAAGGQVVPIPFDISPEALRVLFQQLNGFLFTGGGLNLTLTSQYVKTAKVIFDLIQLNPRKHIPLWGAQCFS